MKHLALLLLAAGLPVIPAPAATDSAGTPAFYAAVAMTKAQRNTSTPADSGLYQRLDSGQWVLTGPRMLGVGSVAIHPATPAIRLIACSDGIVRSADGGKTWNLTTTWEVADVRTIAFDPADPSHVYAVTAWGPLRSVDAGQSWQLAQRGLDRLFCAALVDDRRQAGRVLIGMEEGLYVSTDSAVSWTRLDFPSVPVTRLVQSATQPSVMLATTTGKGAWLSRDAGLHWIAVDPGSASAHLYAAAIAPHDPALMATGGWEVGVRVSADGGKTWTDRSRGLPNRKVFVVAFDPQHPGRLWASTFEEGSFYSDDLGQTWCDGGLYGAYGSDFVFASQSAPGK